MDKMEELLDDVEHGRIEKVKTYLECVLLCDLFTSTQGQDSPMHVAVKQDNEEMVDLLLQHRESVKAINKFGETPLHIACRHGKPAHVKKLIQCGAELDAKDCAECTPLFHAVSRSEVEVVKILIEAGCDLDTLNEELITPLDYAILHNKKEVISLLLKGGCVIDRWDGPVSHPDYWAYSIVFPLWQNCDIKNIQLLVDCGYTTEYSYLRTMIELLKKKSNMNKKNFGMFLQVAELPQSLISQCRVCIRRVFHARRYAIGGSVDAMINRLNLPQKLKNYLAVCDS